MKFHLDRDVLSDAVSWATRTLPQRPAMPILQGVRIVAEEGELKFSTFDYEVSAHISVEADIDEPGEVLVQGKMLNDIVRALPHKTVSVTHEGPKVEILCGSSRFSLATLPVAEYPVLPEMPPVVGTVDSGTFARAISQVSIAASKDDVVPLLTGIKVTIDGEKVMMAATDRYRLAVREFTWNPASPSSELSALVRSRTLTEVARSLSGGNVEIALNEGETANLIGFESSGRRTTSTLVDGDYPPVLRLFPDVTPYTVSVATAPLIEAVKRVSLVAERNTPVRLTFSEGQVALEAGDGDDAQASEVLEAQVDGGDLVVGYNSGFLLDGLGALGTDFTHFSLPDSVKPTVLRGQESLEAAPEEHYRYLLMPMRI
ncbi:DNA polymerase III subunit beta [Dermabacter hominis]|uniref:DNA polymerase III subunit beta n=1 Tax=Dermabacter hominis TaxID=36740 RepID=UPI0021A824FD|nr:DNA polymerase III subunit beta [Dermabacter hominis]MCT2056142.1 DNA polymerase III subunit beta [Dermabacter hominis]MCT2083838.1 DNA polymerase III subunit beta [Dermabacter hominis]MCT2091555.1 DNA polymerase III subunit beta [Dermabacter hominis]MCT2190395.1 DNA polymerase III subunit beta [Dermabacter hominis]MCT2227175.1 DNA polymerase III subunit beta [Dermabacter hominis]